MVIPAELDLETMSDDEALQVLVADYGNEDAARHVLDVLRGRVDAADLASMMRNQS